MTNAEGEDATPPEREAGDDQSGDAEHLRDVADGCGCAELWEHLSEQRDRSGDESPDQ